FLVDRVSTTTSSPWTIGGCTVDTWTTLATGIEPGRDPTIMEGLMGMAPGVDGGRIAPAVDAGTKPTTTGDGVDGIAMAGADGTGIPGIDGIEIMGADGEATR